MKLPVDLFDPPLTGSAYLVKARWSVNGEAREVSTIVLDGPGWVSPWEQIGGVAALIPDAAWTSTPVPIEDLEALHRG